MFAQNYTNFSKVKISVVVGARPNFIKAFALLDYAKTIPKISMEVVHTNQHYDYNMYKIFFDDLGVAEPDHLLNIKNDNGFLPACTVQLLSIFKKTCPDLVIVVGDVSSTLAGALASHLCNIPTAHVEAGLRSHDFTMPEENNRILIDKLSKYLFVSEPSGMAHVDTRGVLVGNTMIDTLFKFKNKIIKRESYKKYNLKRKEFCVATTHRPANVDAQAEVDVISIIEEVAKEFTVIFPIHPRTKKNEAFSKLACNDSVIVIPPLGYIDFLSLLADSALVLTDSGGVQEEATALKVPCFTLRRNTERPITVTKGTNTLVTSVQQTKKELYKLRQGEYPIRTYAFWDGNASARIFTELGL